MAEQSTRAARFAAFIKSRPPQPEIDQLKLAWLVSISCEDLGLAITIAENHNTFCISHGAPSSPVRVAWNAYLAALDNFDRTTRADFERAEAERDIMLNTD